MSHRTYASHGKVTFKVTVSFSPDSGVVMEHPWDSLRGSGYGRRHVTADPGRLADEICADLEAAGYTLEEPS